MTKFLNSSIKNCLIILVLLCCVTTETSLGRQLPATNDFFIVDNEKFKLKLGGVFQADLKLRSFSGEASPGQDPFDLRRVRLRTTALFEDKYLLRIEYELQGNNIQNLIDAYIEIDCNENVSLRIGQFLTPFSLQETGKYEALPFAERSMGWHISPQRDVGIMGHGSIREKKAFWGFGIFNGNGEDGGLTGHEDAPEVIGRIVAVKNNFQFGASASYGKVDRTDVEIHVETTGGTKFFDVASGAKFGIIQDVDNRMRQGLEFAWTNGPLAVLGEAFWLKYNNVLSSTGTYDIDVQSRYLAVFWMVTGENPTLKQGTFQTIVPQGKRAFGVSLRFDTFDGGNNIYDTIINEGESAKKADSISLALNWYIGSRSRVIVDVTHTEFDTPLLVDRDSVTSTALYSDRELAATIRYQVTF